MNVPLQDKNFYFLTLLERNAVRAVGSQESLQRLWQEKASGLDKSAACKGNVPCVLALFRWTEEEIALAGEALAGTPAIVAAVEPDMRTSGMFVRWESLTGAELVRRAWTDAARQMNRIADVYGEGAKPRYAEIDSMAYDPKTPYWGRMMGFLAASLQEESGEMSLFFQPSLRFAVRLLEANHRDEAARYEPLHMGENRAAYQRIHKIRWADYPYPVIIVPGSGTDRLTVALSPTGRERLRLAVRRYQQKKAPLILVSGGNVHPNQTPHNEAIEMKKSLMQEFGIPADAILVEPHARHTTTNLRNAGRLMRALGLQDAVVVSGYDAEIFSQAFYLAHPLLSTFEARCREELGYAVGSLQALDDEHLIAFTPAAEVDTRDFREPLDS